jgi:hypothetical protein
MSVNMKTIKLIITFFLLSIFSISCSKDDKGASATDDGFVFSESGGKLTALKNPCANASKRDIKAGLEDETLVEIDLSSLSVGTYEIGNGSFNYVDYIRVRSTNIRTWTANSGTITITANTNNKLSGNFNVSGENVDGITSLSGNFNNIPIK